MSKKDPFLITVGAAVTFFAAATAVSHGLDSISAQRVINSCAERPANNTACSNTPMRKYVEQAEITSGEVLRTVGLELVGVGLMGMGAGGAFYRPRRTNNQPKPA